MITRRRFIHSSAATLAVGSAGGAEENAALFAVGLIADAQYVDADPGGIRHYRNSIKKLGSAVKSINEAEVDFSIHLGDLIDRDFASFDAILEPLNELKSPVVQIPGNHDFSVPDHKKPEVFGKLGMTKPYHSFSKGGFRFVFLDGTEISTFAHPRDSDVYKEASEILKEFEAQGRKNAKSWNGTISEVQLVWLKGELASAKSAHEKVIISCHYPILPDNSHNLWNDREVLAVIDQFPGTVAAWFNGHNHAGNYAERNGVHYVTVQGMVDTEDENAFAVLEVSPEMLTIRGSGRVPGRELKIA
ncbi:MAG: metallophosphoesterase [Verrucomicrobiales bacterium]|nr:metallophosphoesterase [Verrucomicrobiales bacterium]